MKKYMPITGQLIIWEKQNPIPDGWSYYMEMFPGWSFYIPYVKEAIWIIKN